jgi:hypothetical protein
MFERGVVDRRRPTIANFPRYAPNNEVQSKPEKQRCKRTVKAAKQFLLKINHLRID